MEQIDRYGLLKVGDKCPKCELGKGLRSASALEVALTGWDNYTFLHCDTCGAFFVGKGKKYMYLPLRPLTDGLDD